MGKWGGFWDEGKEENRYVNNQHSQPTNQQDEDRYGWVLVVLAFLFFGLGNGALNSISVFLVPLEKNFGWLRGDIAFAYTAGTLSFGLCGIGMGWLADRFPIRPIVLGGTLCMGISLLLLSTQTALWQLILFHIFLGGLGYSTFWSPLLANLGNWFDRNRGLAVGLATSGQMLGVGIVPFTALYLISLYGWRDTYSILGFTILGLLLPLGLLIRNPPGKRKKEQVTPPAVSNPDHLPQIVRPWFISCWHGGAILFDRTLAGTVMVHIVAMAQDHGIKAQSAGSVLLIFFVFSFLSRIAFGKLADKIGGIQSWLIALSGMVATVFWLTQVHSLASFFTLAAILGLFNASALLCILSIQALVPSTYRGRSTAIVSLCGFGGMGLGGWQAGVFFDLSGSYVISFAIAVISGLIGLVLISSLFYYIRRRAALAG